MNKQITHNIGNEVIHLHITQWGASGIVYINLHENEQTSVEAGKEILSKTNGTLIEIKSKGERMISFNLDGTLYTFDPNRIFTSEGIRKTLTENGANTIIAEQLVAAFATTIIQQLQAHQPRLIVALHNTTGQYTIDNYLDGGEYEKDRGDIFINPNHDITDFFFTTDRRIFEKIKTKKYSVLLQNNETVADDGSLSVYCSSQIPYINIETLHGHKEMQMEMISFINSKM